MWNVKGMKISWNTRYAFILNVWGISHNQPSVMFSHKSKAFRREDAFHVAGKNLLHQEREQKTYLHLGQK